MLAGALMMAGLHLVLTVTTVADARYDKRKAENAMIAINAALAEDGRFPDVSTSLGYKESVLVHGFVDEAAAWEGEVSKIDMLYAIVETTAPKATIEYLVTRSSDLVAVAEPATDE